MTWPAELWVVRHGESSGNVARDRAEASGLERIELTSRDVDVPLSERGEEQARALAGPLRDLQPDAVWCSPYQRARQTAELALQGPQRGSAPELIVDERLREREFGVLDGLTRKGITALWPRESERRAAVGKFYHRPPGGESWTDALLRVRSAIADIRADHPDQRVVVVAHQVVVLLFRYVIEGMDEQAVLAVDREGDVRNCAITSFRRAERGMRLTRYNDVGHLVAQQQPVTAEPDVAHAPR